MLETERCVISKFDKKDYSDVKKVFLNEEVRQYLGGIRNEESIKDVLSSMLQPSENAYYWVA